MMISPSFPKPLRILIVDDCADTAASLATLLSMSGHQVRTAPSGAAALDEAGAFWPDVVVLDIGMPGLDGWEVARRLRRVRPDGLLLVAMTGYGMEEDRTHSRDAGFDHHLVKPFDFSELNRLLANACVAVPAQ